MKIALVTETFPPEVNGVAMTLHRLVSGLAAKGHEVTVVRPRQNSGDRSRVEGGFEHLVVPGMPLPRYEGLHMGFPVFPSLMRHWQNDRPDVVHIATEGPLGWAALAAADRLGMGLSSSFHTNFHQYGDHYGYGFARGVAVAWLRHFHNRTDITMVPTDQMAGELSKLEFDRLRVLARGVDAELFDPVRRSAKLREEWGAGPDDIVVSYVGRLAAEKNIGLAVRGFEAMKAIEPRCRFVLVGDGPARKELEAAHPDFHFCGMRRGEDLAAHYASGDVFLSPSITETFGNVVTEGLASGLIVVTYDYAAGRQLIRSGENGLLAPLGDERAFIQCCETAVRDRDRSPEIRRSARETAREVTWESIVNRFESLLGSVAGGRKAPQAV